MGNAYFMQRNRATKHSNFVRLNVRFFREGKHAGELSDTVTEYARSVETASKFYGNSYILSLATISRTFLYLIAGILVLIGIAIIIMAIIFGLSANEPLAIVTGLIYGICIMGGGYEFYDDIKGYCEKIPSKEKKSIERVEELYKRLRNSIKL